MTQLNIDFPDTSPPSPNRTVDTVLPLSKTQAVASSWARYSMLNKLNPKTKKYRETQHAYLCGIANLLGEATPNAISMCLHSGRDILTMLERTQPR